jgi:hypothetical protein
MKGELWKITAVYQCRYPEGDCHYKNQANKNHCVGCRYCWGVKSYKPIKVDRSVLDIMEDDCDWIRKETPPDYVDPYKTR